MKKSSLRTKNKNRLIGARAEKLLKECFYKIAPIGGILQTVLIGACVEKILKDTFYKKAL